MEKGRFHLIAFFVANEVESITAVRGKAVIAARIRKKKEFFSPNMTLEPSAFLMVMLNWPRSQL
jgi:hypothetical protein